MAFMARLNHIVTRPSREEEGEGSARRRAPSGPLPLSNRVKVNSNRKKEEGKKARYPFLPTLFFLKSFFRRARDQDSPLRGFQRQEPTTTNSTD